MPLRLIQIVLPERGLAEADALVDDDVPIGRWPTDRPEGGEVVQFVVEADRAEPLIDRFTNRFDGDEGFQITLLSVDAALPSPADSEGDGPKGNEDDQKAPGRVSREELHADAMDSARLSGVFLAMVTASTIVAAIGILRDDIAAIIGAMVIAPLLGPNVSLALAVTLADRDLARRAALTNAAGIGLALALSIGIGFLASVDPSVGSIAARTAPSGYDMILALAAGSAGAIAFTSGLPQAVVGVMVAVALLPPLVIVGLLLGAGMPALAAGAFLLLAINIICVNLAGVGTFLARGLRPAGWREAKEAKTAVRWAIGTWVALLLVLAGVLWIARTRGIGPFAD